MLLNEFAFNEIRSLLNYRVYLCHYAGKIHNKATGSCFDNNTAYMEAIFLHLQKDLKAKNLNEVFNFIKEVTEVEISDSWMSPMFMEMFNYYCEKEHE